MAGDPNDLNETDDADILEKMDEVRGKLDNDIDKLHENMKSVFDWQAYVKAAPLTSVAVAAAAGYWLAPAIRTRKIQVIAPSLPEKAEGGIFSSLSGIAMSALARIATGYLTEWISAPANQPDTPDVPQSAPDQTFD